jgi:hypothetical protein
MQGRALVGSVSAFSKKEGICALKQVATNVVFEKEGLAGRKTAKGRQAA